MLWNEKNNKQNKIKQKRSKKIEIKGVIVILKNDTEINTIITLSKTTVSLKYLTVSVTICHIGSCALTDLKLNPASSQ